MPECPHCNAHFESWFPLKKHLYEDSLYCVEEEEKLQAQIRARKAYLQQQAELLRRLAEELGTPPVTP